MGDRRSSAATRRSCCFPHAAGSAQTTRSPNIVPDVRRVGVLRAVQVAPRLLVGGPNNPELPAAVQHDVGPRPDDERGKNDVTTNRAHRPLVGVWGRPLIPSRSARSGTAHVDVPGDQIAEYVRLLGGRLPAKHVTSGRPGAATPRDAAVEELLRQRDTTSTCAPASTAMSRLLCRRPRAALCGRPRKASFSCTDDALFLRHEAR